HLNDIPAVLRELHRVTKDGAIINIGVPYFASVGAWTDLTHKHPFTYYSLDYMATKVRNKHATGNFNKWAYGKERYEILETKFIFGKLHKLMGVSWFAHKFPMFYELYLPFIFPPRCITFKIKTVKGGKND
ncbi:unnamed protein product, partial [marine sediment metagenome]